MPKTYTTAMLAGSFCWNAGAVEATQPSDFREQVANEAQTWQHLSYEGANAEMYAHPSLMRRQVTFNGSRHVIEPKQGKAPREPNRIVEIHGLMGAIGEQLGLAWTAEQDVQRLNLTRATRDPIHHRLVARAQAELAGHFVLGAAHSLANLVIRLLLLNAEAADILTATFKKAKGFPPGTDDRNAWLTFNRNLIDGLKLAVSDIPNVAMSQAVDCLEVFDRGDAFRLLDARRGMDYHRRRPQSVPHASPRDGTVSQTLGGGTMIVGGVPPTLEPEADENAVHRTVVEAMESTADTMLQVRTAIATAIRAEGISYIYGDASVSG